VPGVPRPNLRQDEWRDCGWHQTEADLAKGEESLVARDRDVGGGHESAAAAKTRPMYPSDDHRTTIDDALKEIRQSQCISCIFFPGVRRSFAHPLEVATGAKRIAGSGKHNHPNQWRNRTEHSGQFRDEFVVEGVSHAGTIDRNAKDRPFGLHVEHW
jgi:hypothetical protein